MMTTARTEPQGWGLTASEQSTRVRRPDVSDRCPIIALRFRTDAALRHLVDTATGCFSRAVGVHYLCDVGSLPGAAFQVRTLSLAVLFPRIVRRTESGLAWSYAKLDACLGDCCATHSLGAGRLPSNVLLLPRCILQSLLGGPTFLHRGGAAEEIPRRTLVSLDHAKH